MSELRPIRVADARPLPGFRPWFGMPAEPVATEAPDVEPAAEAFAKGFDLGVQEARAQQADERARYQALMAACEALQPESSDQLALLIAESVEQLVRLIVGEVPVDQKLLTTRAQRVAAIVADCDRDRKLLLHPDDIVLLDPQQFPLPLVADLSVSRGSVRMESASGWVEDGVSTHLQILREQLGLTERQA